MECVCETSVALFAFVRDRVAPPALNIPATGKITFDLIIYGQEKLHLSVFSAAKMKVVRVCGVLHQTIANLPSAGDRCEPIAAFDPSRP